MKRMIKLSVIFSALMVVSPLYAAEGTTQSDRIVDVAGGSSEVCGGVTLDGKIIYFPCQNPPRLACAKITPEGKIIYGLCNKGRENKK